MSRSSHSKARPLRAALLFNAAFSIFTGVGSFEFAETLSEHLGGLPPMEFRILGGGLLAFAIGLIWQATRQPPKLFWALMTTLADGMWVLGSAVILVVAADSFTAVGVEIVAGVALVVLLAAFLQWRGIRHVVRCPDARLHTAYRHTVRVVAPVPQAALWPVLADIGALKQHTPALADSRLEDPDVHGVGMVRHCTDPANQRWSEQVTHWREGVSFEMRFLTEADGFPFPMDPMHGGWTLSPIDAESTQVEVWWAFSTRPAWAAPAFISLMDRTLHADIAGMVASMVETARATNVGGEQSDYRATVAPREGHGIP